MALSIYWSARFRMSMQSIDSALASCTTRPILTVTQTCCPASRKGCYMQAMIFAAMALASFTGEIRPSTKWQSRSQPHTPPYARHTLKTRPAQECFRHQGIAKQAGQANSARAKVPPGRKPEKHLCLPHHQDNSTNAFKLPSATSHCWPMMSSVRLASAI